MTKLEVPVFSTTIQKTNIWLNDLSEAMGWRDQHLSYLALRAVLHALRDRLPIEITAKFAAQLPMLIRGIYYEGWVPSGTPFKVHNTEEFLELVALYLANDLLIPHTETITTNVFKVLSKHVSKGEIEHLKKVLPQPIASFWC